MTEDRPNTVPLWDAINEYAAACGGDTSANILSDRRMEAVVLVERAVAALLRKPQPREDLTMQQPTYTYHDHTTGQDRTVTIRYTRYDLGRLAIILVDTKVLPDDDEDGPWELVVTTNLPNQPLNHDEFFCKDHGFQEGIAQWLVDNKIAERTGRTVQSGFVSVPVMRRII